MPPRHVLRPLAVAALGALLLGAHSGRIPAGDLRLARIFGDGAVLQREKPIVVWGWAAPNANVAVSLHGRTSRARAAANGTWRATLPAEQAGGPFELSVRSGEGRVDVHNILIGDVWVASGQSNMEFTVAQANDAAREIATANDSSIRQFKVPNSWANAPEADLAGGSWTPADPKHVGAFTAVGYFFARELRKSVNVPIGIVNTTWGGSNIETWMSRDALHLTERGWSVIARAQDARVARLRDSLRSRFGTLPTTDAGLVGDRALWADPALDDSTWQSVRVPGYWESQGYPGMDGVAWYRLAFALDESERQRGATLHLAAIDDDDITWINGTEVGRTTGYNVRRAYRIPAAALRAGRNVLTVRVADGGGGGGINGPVALAFSDGAQRSLDGAWKFKIGEVSFRPDGQQLNKVPTLLYNKMVHPLLPLGIKGVVWYQGESNANDMDQATTYRAQFVALIRSWRREWGSGAPQDAFPFLWVQLPNYGSADAEPPAQAAWATQRESMAAALSLPHTGQAIAIDVGESDDIHPKNKQDVGVRLARVARQVVYGQQVVASGPTYRSHIVRGDTVLVAFNNIVGGLMSRSNDGRVGGFAVAGADRKFVWAEAAIDGARVRVWSDRVRRPVAVRYAWANNPDRANLYNGERLPAAPFRTDRW